VVLLMPPRVSVDALAGVGILYGSVNRTELPNVLEWGRNDGVLGNSNRLGLGIENDGRGST